MAVCRTPIQPLSRCPSPGRGEGTARSSGAALRTGRLLTGGCHGQSRLSLQELGVTYCRLKTDGERQRQKLERLSPSTSLAAGPGCALRCGPSGAAATVQNQPEPAGSAVCGRGSPPSPHRAPAAPATEAWARTPGAVKASEFIYAVLFNNR